MPRKVKGILRDELLRQIAERLMEKVPIPEIAQELNMTVQFVKRAEGIIKNEWKKKDSLETARSRVLYEERHLRRVYWDTFKEDRQLKRPGHAFLKGIGESLQREVKLLGLEMPTKITLSELDTELNQLFDDLKKYNTVPGEVLAEVQKLLPEETGEETESGGEEQGGTGTGASESNSRDTEPSNSDRGGK